MVSKWKRPVFHLAKAIRQALSTLDRKLPRDSKKWWLAAAATWYLTRSVLRMDRAGSLSVLGLIADQWGCTSRGGAQLSSLIQGLWPAHLKYLCRNASPSINHVITLSGDKEYRRDCIYPIIWRPLEGRKKGPIPVTPAQTISTTHDFQWQQLYDCN